MRNKRLLKEYTEVQVVKLEGSPKLQGAFTFGCFKSPDMMTNKDGKEAVYRKATKAENAANPHIFFYEDGRKEFRNEQDKVVKETTWYCKETENKTDPAQMPWMKDAIGQLTDYFNYKLHSQVSGGDVINYTLVNLKDTNNLPENLKNDPNYKALFEKQDFYMWKPNALTQKQENVIEKGKQCVDFYTKKGYQEGTPGPGIMADVKDLNSLSDPACKGKFNGPYTMWKETDYLGQAQLPTNLGQWRNNSKQRAEDEKLWCRNGITLYYQAWSKKTEASPDDINDWKKEIASCVNSYGNKFLGLRKEIEMLKTAGPIKTPGGRQLRYGIFDTRTESIEKKLKSIIRENLATISENKKKSLVQEQKIVNTRFKFLLENTNTKTKKGQKELAKQLFVETSYLHTQGFDKKIINEGFWDMLKGLFGDSVDGALEYFKEYAAKWLLDQFGVDSSGWIGSIVITAIGNLDLADIPKLTDCNFVTKLLSKSLAEGAIRKLQEDKGATGPLAGILRNTVVEVLSETDLGQKIESALGSVLCPMISKIAGKMGMAGDTLKSNAMGATDFEGGGMMDSIGKLIPGLGGSAMSKLA
jgi:hypothetical protein